MGAKPSFSEMFARGLFRAAALWSLVLLLVAVAICGRNWDMLGLSIALAMAAGSLGSLVGLIMGIPKVADAETKDALTTVIADRPDAALPLVRLVYNTNLAKISDWVTTVLVGLTLVNARQIVDALGGLGQRFGEMFDTNLPNNMSEAAYGLSLTISAFMITAGLSYMWTQTRLVDALRQMHQAIKDL